MWVEGWIRTCEVVFAIGVEGWLVVVKAVNVPPTTGDPRGGPPINVSDCGGSDALGARAAARERRCHVQNGK